MKWERKVVKLGEGSRTPIFPKPIIDDMGLKVGDIVEFDYDDKKKEIVIRKK